MAVLVHPCTHLAYPSESPLCDLSCRCPNGQTSPDLTVNSTLTLSSRMPHNNKKAQLITGQLAYGLPTCSIQTLAVTTTIPSMRSSPITTHLNSSNYSHLVIFGLPFPVIAKPISRRWTVAPHAPYTTFPPFVRWGTWCVPT